MSKVALKEAALPLFAEQGYDGTALSEIAKAVGIKTPSIYAHFASKEALFMEIYRDVMQHELAMLEEVAKETHSTTREELHAFFYKVTDFHVDPQVKRFFQRAIFFPPQSLAKQMREEMATYETLTSKAIGTILLRTLDKAKQENWVYVFYCLLDGLSLEHEIYSAEDFEKRRSAAWGALEVLLA